jgi:hypothetical protein
MGFVGDVGSDASTIKRNETRGDLPS